MDLCTMNRIVVSRASSILHKILKEDEEGDAMLEGDEAPSHFDLIKCGDCRADFALSDIVKFIEHKRKCFGASNGSITPEDSPTLQLITKEGVQVKEETDDESLATATPTANDSTTKLERREDDEENDEMETASVPTDIVRTEKPKIITPIKPRRMSSTGSQRETNSPRVKQTQTQTEAAKTEAALEPDNNLICINCKEPFENARDLLQHVQEDHGMHIYQQPHQPKSPNTPVSESSRASVEPRPPSESASPHSTGSAKTPSSLPPASSYHPSHLPPPPLPVHSPHQFPPHLDGPFAGMFLPRVLMDRSMPCPPDRMFPGPLNPMLVRDMIHNHQEHHFHMHPPMPQHPPPPRLPPPPPPSTSASGIPTSAQESYDTYSRKLQELATGGPSPIPPPPPPRTMSPKKHLFQYPSMFSHQRNFKPPFPPKGKACEFCGKQFKFQSNLIVHRRSHTGEKPYKCHLCDHACSQASKLKRHMKTHKKISPSNIQPPITSTGSSSPSSDTQDDGSASNILKSVAQYITDTKSSGGNTSDEDEGDYEPLDEEEAEERARMEKEDQEMIKARERERDKDKEESERERDEEAKENSIDMPMEDEEATSPSNDSNKDSKEEDGPTSLLTEVMKNTGLGDIPQYTEAFRQAMAENRERNNSYSASQRSPSIEDGLSDKDGSRDGMEDSRQRSPSISQHSPSIGHRSPSIGHRSPSIGGRSPTGSHLDRHPSTSPQSLHSSLESHYARLQEVEQSLHPSHHMESTSAMRELEIVAKRIKVEPTSPSSWVQTATDAAALPRPRSDPYFFSQTSENGPTATNGNLSGYYSRHKHHHHHLDHNMDGHGPTALPGLPMRYSPMLHKSSHHHPHHKGPLSGGSRRNDQCEYCGKIFKNCSNLTVHRRSHTGEKPYKCNLCSYACAQSSKLTRHMKTHGQGAKEVFKCEVCGMPFSVYSTLEKHMKKSHWGAIKGTAPKPESVNASQFTSPHKTTSPTSQFPLIGPNQ